VRPVACHERLTKVTRKESIRGDADQSVDRFCPSATSTRCLGFFYLGRYATFEEKGILVLPLQTELLNLSCESDDVVSTLGLTNIEPVLAEKAIRADSAVPRHNRHLANILIPPYSPT
jgi:hypothetical protein